MTAADDLIACPQQATEQQRSGTWSTVRYARSMKRWHIVITPDGKTHEYHAPAVSS